MTHTTKNIIIILIAILVLFGGYELLHKPKNVPSENNNATSTASNTVTSTSTANGGVKTEVSGPSGNYTIEQVPLSEGKEVPQPIPNFSRLVVFASHTNFDAETKARITQKIVDLQAAIKKNPSYLAAWIDLGIYEKMIGDYEGAVIDWQYATKLLPGNFVAYGNLADLYAYYLHDNVKAENYFKLAISKDPTQESQYTKFALFYRDVVKDNAKALNVINQGLAKLPNNPNLLQIKASLK